MLGGAGADSFVFNDGSINIGDYDQIGDFQDGGFGVGDTLYLSAALQSVTSVQDTPLGALVLVTMGLGSWGVYCSGATAAQVQDQLAFV
jgi:Ca2+-binding RTX toxin-like protein